MSTFHAAAMAAAIAAKLPFAFPVLPAPSTDPGATGRAVAVAFVGAPGATVAIQVADVATLDDGSAGSALADRLHPVFEAAVAVLGAGTLGDGEEVDAAGVFTVPGAQVFDLVREDGSVVARAAIRIDDAAAAAPAAPTRISRIAGVEMELVVEIGRTRMAVRDVLSLEPGRVVELDRAAGSPADITLNGRLIGHGTVVVADGDYAVRVERIIDQAETA
ncbi:FliM/FliN family flagellar motor switch protein [Microbacterium sp. NPDC089180]|uniref:FliM/FliN family flagellar motor switch protein n=1 Tax=unclassified Microbacterium TaxID=2609290 RepID=UPI0034236380